MEEEGTRRRTCPGCVLSTGEVEVRLCDVLSGADEVCEEVLRTGGECCGVFGCRRFVCRGYEAYMASRFQMGLRREGGKLTWDDRVDAHFLDGEVDGEALGERVDCSVDGGADLH